MKIFLCRHGQTTGDIEDRCGGAYDDHLTDLGKSQGEVLTEKLQKTGIQKIFVSPLIRAQETAQILNTILNVETEIVSDLKERDQNGILTGMIRSKAKQKYPELVEKVRDYKNTIEGAENYDSFSSRVHNAISEITKKDHEVVAIVTHGGPIKVILREIENGVDYKIEDCAFAQLNTNNGKLEIVSLNGITPTK